MIKGGRENSALTGDGKSRFFYGYVVASAGFLIWLVAWGMVMTFGVFFKPMITEFGWSRAMFSGAATLSQIIVGLTGIITGRLTDKIGIRLVATGGGLFLGLGFLALSQINALWQFYLVYGVVISIGLGTTIVPMMSTTTRWFVARRGVMTGVVQSGGGLGGVIMPPLAGWLILNYGWRDSYVILGAIALILIVLTAQFLKSDPGQIGRVPYGEDEVKTGTADLPARGFSIREVIYSRQFWMLWVIFFCIGFSRGVILIHIAPYAADLGFSLIAGATILAIISGSSILGRLAFGRMADSVGNKPTLIISFIMVAIMLLWLLVARELWMLYVFAVIFGLGWGSLAVLRFSVVSELFGLSSLGMILGIIELGAAVGGAGGPFLSGWIFDATGGYFSAFLISAGVATTGIVISWLLRPISENKAKVEWAKYA